MENESTPALSEDIYSTQDNLLGDMNIGSYSENIQIQPVNTSVSSWRQFEPICKFHRIQVFHDEMTFQNLTQGSSYTKEPELESQMYNHTKDPSVKQASLKEESPVETPMSVKEDQLIHERVRGSQSPPLNYCSREMMEFMEKSLATYTAADSVLNLLYKESISRNDENVFDNDNSFDLHDLRVDYKTEKPEVSSKEIENSGEVPEMSVSQEEVTAEGLESLAIASCWSAAGVSKSGAASQNCMTPDISFQSLDLLEEDVALNEALQKLKHTNKQQEMQIQDLQCRNLHLECKIKELQMKITKQQVFVDIINKLKETVEELIENKYNLILEKNDINKKFQDSQKILSNTQRYLQEFRKVKDTLQLQVKKIKVSYIRLQERYATEMQQKNRSISQCMEMEKTLSKKDEEIESLHQLKGELEKTNSSTLELLKREKEIREQEFLSFQEEFQRHEKESLRERRKLKSRVEKLIAQVKNALVTCENERAKNTKLQQQIDELKNENSALQQQVAESKEQCSGPSLELTQLKKPLEGAMEPESAQGIKAVHSNLIMNYSSYDEESLAPPAVKKTFPLTSKIHSLLTLMVGLLVRQDIASPDAECCRESKKATDITLYKLKSFQLKKKDLDKELLKHKNKITTLKELIANAKSSRDSIIEVTGFDADHAMVVRDVPIVLATKLDTYHRLNEELDFLITKLESLLEGKEDHCNRLIEENDRYRRHVGSLINKVTSYEEIIKCADQRLEISHSQIAHLEERNRHLEDLIRMPREKARKPKPRLESHPKSMTVVGHPDGLCHDCSTSM